MYTNNYAVRKLPEIVTTSGYALIHFYSDIAVNMSGFNISYRYNYSEFLLLSIALVIVQI